MGAFTGVPGLGTGMMADLAKGIIGGGEGGIGSALRGLFSNKLFLQMLGAAGADIAGGTGGKNTLQAIHNNIVSQNYMNLLGKMLGGDMSGGGKISLDQNGMNIKVPATANANVGTGTGTSGVTQPTAQPAAVTPTSGDANLEQIIGALQGAVGGGALNPFVQAPASSFNPSDLAGLDPQTITQALAFKFNQEEMKQKRITDLVDALYKGSLMDYNKAQIELGHRQADNTQYGNETDRINAGRQLLELMTKDERTAMQKDYDRAKEEGFEGKLEDWAIMSKDPEMKQLYDMSVADGSWKPEKQGGLWNFIRERAKAGAPYYTPFEQTRQREAAQAQADVMRPDFVNTVIEDLLKSTGGSGYGNGLLASALEASTALKSQGISNPTAAQIKTAQTMLTRKKVREECHRRITQAFPDNTVKYKAGLGWYVDGKLTVKDPYANQ